MTGQVLILGASGRIGRHSAQAFAAAGWRVRRYDRAKGDMTQAAQGCDIIVNGLNPPNYHNWAKLIPEITRQVIAAAQASGASVVVPGNVYHYGKEGGVWSEATPARPVSRKGQIRLDMERAYAASGVQTLVLRAGNFIDPEAQGCVMSGLYLRAIGKGRITSPGPADTKQAFCYVPDWARACVVLAEQRERFPRFEDIPFPGFTKTTRDIQHTVEALTGRKMRIVGFPWWAMTLAAPVWELARELREMRYLWETDHALSGARLDALLPGFQATPFETALDQVLSAMGQRRGRAQHETAQAI